MAGAFYTAAGGLRNQQIKMDAIASNIANINTAGYKASTTIFGELLSQTLRGAAAPQGVMGGLNPMLRRFDSRNPRADQSKHT